MAEYAHPAFQGLIGLAAAEITPPVGIPSRNWGAATFDTAAGIHRGLTLTVLTVRVSGDAPPLVLAAADLGWWRRVEDEAFVRRGAAEDLGLDTARLVLCLSHTHAGPSLNRDDAARDGGEYIGPYLDGLRRALVSTTRKALASERPGVLEWNYGVCSLARDRDMPDRSGSGRFLVGFHPGASADSTLLVGRVTTGTGEALATLVNYACHPTTLAWENRLISPDFVGAMRTTIEEARDGAPCLFVQGASGELAPRDQYVRDPAAADRNGRVLGYAALAALADMLPPWTGLNFAGVVESGGPLAEWRRSNVAAESGLDARLLQVEVPLKPLRPIGEIDAELASTTEAWTAERLRRQREMRANVGEGTTFSLPVWLWRIGDAGFVGIPGEPYSALQRELRAAFPGRAIIVSNHCNGSLGYLPPRALYDKDIYTVWQSPFGAGTLEAVIEATRAALAEMFERTS